MNGIRGGERVAERPSALEVGENAIMVVVTAEDGTTTRTYTVTVTRPVPPTALTLGNDPAPAPGWTGGHRDGDPRRADPGEREPR